MRAVALSLVLAALLVAPVAAAEPSRPPRAELIAALRGALEQAAADSRKVTFPFALGAERVEGRVLEADEKGLKVEAQGSPFVQGSKISLSWNQLKDGELYALGASALRNDVASRTLLLRFCLACKLDDGVQREARKIEDLGGAVPPEAEALLHRPAAAPPPAAPTAAKAEAKEDALSDGLPRHRIVFPKDAGCADVKAEYGAKGDGVTDDTEALQKAFNSNNDDHGRLIYFPAGTYLISKKLVCLRDGQPWYGLQLIGEHRDRTILKLKDKCPGFENPEKPETMIEFSSKGSVWGNMAHWNSCWNMTLDTGTGNPGAIATNYYASNHGSMRDVTIRSGDGHGVCGLNMNGPWPGPCLVANTQIIGFDTGIAVGTREYGVTFRAVTLDRQHKVGLWNHSNMVSVHRLRVRECSGPAIQNLRREWVPGMLTLIDSDLNGLGSAGYAIDDVRSVVWLRNVKAIGYAAVMKGIPSPVAQYSNQKTQSLWAPPSGAMPNVPAQDPPDIPWDPPGEWARGGDAAQTQRAIDSGKMTVYIPYGEHTYEKPVVIRGNVRRILGMKSNLWSGKGLNGGPMWIYESTTAPEVEFNFLTCGKLEHRSPKALVLRTMRGCAYSGNAAGSGPLFIEDVCAGPWTFTNPMKVWAWQWNPEVDNYQVKANGGTFWVCGWKTEGNGTQFVLDGSLLELLGGLVYPHNMKDGIPMFVFKDSAVSMLVRYCSYGGKGTPDRAHDVKVVETRGGETRQTEKLDESLFLAGDDATLAKLQKSEGGTKKPSEPATAGPPRLKDLVLP
jgi:hypothetical protein